MKALKNIGKWLSWGFLPIRRNFAFFVSMYILGLICAYLTVPDKPGYRPYSLAAEELYFDVFFLCIVLTILPRKARPWIRGLFYALAYGTALIDMYCYVKFDSTLTPTMLLLVGETNTGEASEFLHSYLSMDILASSVGLIVLLIIAHIFFAVFHKRVWRWTKNTIRNCDRAKELAVYTKHAAMKAKPYCMATAGLAAAVLFVVYGNMCWDNKKLYHKLMSYSNIGDVEHELTEKRHAVQYQPLYRLAFSIYANELTAKQLVRLKESLNDVKVDSCSFRSRNIVLIIGESYNRNHSQLYGYKTPNTPRQMKMYRRGDIVPFTDVVSPWNLTSFVFKHIFSLYTVGDKGEWCDWPLFPEVFRKAGYHVTFMTNQFLPQAKEAVYDFSGGFFLNDEELSKAQFDTRNTSLYQFDNGLLCDYDKRREDGDGKPQLIIFHLKGQHVDYRSRCPQNRKKFNKDYYKDSRPELNDKQRTILSDYDNAILYNDSIVDAIVNKFKKDDAIVIYVPDHGEECFENGLHFYGRMHSTEVTARLAHAEFEIPMWIWASKKYRATHPDIWNRVKISRNQPYMTDALPYMLLDLAGIRCPQYRDELNILSDRYNAKRKRILKNQADYDVLMAKEKAEKAKKEESEKTNDKRKTSGKTKRKSRK